MKSASWILPLLLVAVGCSGGGHEPAPAAEPEAQHEAAPAPAGASEPAAAAEPPTAVADLAPTPGNQATGTAHFTAQDGHVMLTIELRNAPPGSHAVHIHEHGDCSAPDGSSAGAHWNPTTEAHGKWGVSPFHLGDIGNVEVGADGTGSLTMTSDVWSIGGTEHDIVGKAVIVHASQDDFASQPAGNAGARIACGVIEQQG